MANKAQIVIYDDLLVIDETEAFFKDDEQLAGIATSCLRSTPNAEVVEVYLNGKLKMKFSITRRGKIKSESIHPGWGGARKGAGRKPKGEESVSYATIHLRVNKDLAEFLDAMLDKKCEYIRQAIREKRERDKGSQ